MLNVIDKKISNLACFDIRSFKNVAQSSYSLAMGKSFILTYVLTVFSMYSSTFIHLCCNFY